MEPDPGPFQEDRSLREPLFSFQASAECLLCASCLAELTLISRPGGVDWVAVKELKLSCHNPETILLRYIHLMVT